MKTMSSLWLFAFFVIFGFFVLYGGIKKKRYLGILIDERNKMSLSRFQLIMWTCLIISSFFAAAITYRTMDIHLPVEVLALMGISLGTTSAAIMVKSNKKGKGVLHERATPPDARIGDVFMGDETGDNQFVDIGKVQMFFFTLAALAGYAWQLWSFDFSSTSSILFPKPSASLVAIIGLSHIGYLTIKAAPKIKP